MTGTPASACSRSTSAHDVDGDRVEPGERLVEDEHVGPEDERGGQLDPLLVAQAERLELGVAPVGEAEAVQPAHAPPRGLPRPSCRAARRGRRAAPPRASSDTGRAPRACSRCGAGPRRSAARRASAPRRHRRASTPSTIRIVVVLPAPLRPTKPNSSPARTSNVRSCTATVCPYRFEIPSISSCRGGAVVTCDPPASA